MFWLINHVDKSVPMTQIGQSETLVGLFSWLVKEGALFSVMDKLEDMD